MSRLRFVLCMMAVAVACGWFVGFEPAFGQAVAPIDRSIKIDGEYGPFLPTDVSAHGYHIDRLIRIMHWFMGGLFVAWGIFFVYCLMRFRARTGHRAICDPIKAKPSKYAEIGVAIFEAVVLVAFAMPVWASIKNDLPKPEGNPFRVRVLGEQFAWNFHYPGADNQYGKTAPKYVNTATNPLGLDPSDPHGQDDIYAGELHLPIHRPVIAEISSKDVIHSFFVPVLRVKQDAIPGMRIPIWFEAVKEGTYEVACAQLCGNNHYAMRALMVLETEEKLGEWMAQKSAPPEEFEE